MQFKFSKCVALQLPDLAEGKAFYSDILGLSAKEISDGYHMSPGDGNLFIAESDTLRGPVLEFIVDDVEAAKKYLLQRGCKIVRWLGAGKDCYLKDPFGTVFNLWEEKK